MDRESQLVRRTPPPRHGWCMRLLLATTIDPRTNSYIAYWDFVTTAALIYTALVTPVSSRE